MKQNNLLSVLFVIFLSVLFAATTAGPAPCANALVSWQPIKSLGDHHVLDIAQFAVSVYNNDNEKDLRFEEVTHGEVQVAGNRTYRLTVNVQDGAETAAYVATVEEKPSLQLVCFQKA